MEELPGEPKTMLRLTNPSTDGVTVIRKTLRPDTGDNQSLPCTQCPISTPDSMFAPCCGMPMCNNCLAEHIFCEHSDD